jgi:hypothetical protein
VEIFLLQKAGHFEKGIASSYGHFENAQGASFLFSF